MAKNIKVVLEIDNTRYIANLNSAKNATKDFSASAKTSADTAGASFDRLNARTNTLSVGLGRLKSLLAVGAFAGFGRSALGLAADISDLSDTTGMAIEDITAFRTALGQFGGNAADASNIIIGFYRNLEQATSGSKETITQFERVGVTFSDLQNLSDQDIFKKTLEGLAKIRGEGNTGQSIALSMQLLSKAAGGVKFSDEFLQQLQEAKILTAGQSDAIKEADRVTEQFAYTWDTLRIQFLKAFTPIISGISDLLKKIPDLTKYMAILGGIIVTTFVASGIKEIVALIGGATRGIARLWSTIQGKKLKGTFIDDLGSVLGLGAGAAAGAEFLSLINQAPGEQTTAPTPARPPSAREVQDPYAPQKKSLQDITKEYTDQNDLILKRLESEGRMIGMTEAQKARVKAISDLEKDREATIAKLEAKRIQSPVNAKERELNRVLDEQIASINANAEAHRARIDSTLAGNEQLERSLKAQQDSLEATANIQQKVKDIQDNYLLDSLVGIEKQVKQIEIAERNAAEAAKLRVRQQYVILPTDAQDIRLEKQRRIQEEEAKIEENFQKSVDAQTEAARKGYESSRTFERGWNKALKEYVENVTNAAKQASDIFTTMTQNMEEAIIQFAKTGKFEWRSFVSSIVEELLRQQVRELIAKTFGGFSNSQSQGGGGGGLFGSIGKLLGFANGGIIPTNAPVLVGERGPELLMNARGSQVIPNNQLGGTTNVIYNINAVDAQSFKQLVARDPAFIYAVSQQGAKSIPSTRR